VIPTDSHFTITLDDINLRARAMNYDDFADWLTDRRHRRMIPHRLESVGYESIRNDGAKDSRWVIDGRRQTGYAKTTLSIRDRYLAAGELGW
jgi:hypothetical protein